MPRSLPRLPMCLAIAALCTATTAAQAKPASDEPCLLEQVRLKASQWTDRACDAIGSAANRVEAGVEQSIDATTAFADRVHERTIGAAERAVRHAIQEATIEAEHRLAERLGVRTWTGDAWAALGPDDAVPSHAAVLIHGLDNTGDIFTPIAPELEARDVTPLLFVYRNDQHPTAAADELERELAALGERGLGTVDLAGHSMGGLIARDVATREREDGGPAIGRVITLGSPSAGAPLAPGAWVSDAREHVLAFVSPSGWDLPSALACTVDGHCEASGALEPGSDYLTALNARPWPDDIALTVVAGRTADTLSNLAGGMMHRSAVLMITSEGCRERISRCVDGATGTLGDWVVTVDSASAYHTGDLEIVNGNHRSVVARFPAEDTVRGWLGLEHGLTEGGKVLIDRLASRAPALTP